MEALVHTPAKRAQRDNRHLGALDARGRACERGVGGSGGGGTGGSGGGGSSSNDERVWRIVRGDVGHALVKVGGVLVAVLRHRDAVGLVESAHVAAQRVQVAYYAFWELGMLAPLDEGGCFLALPLCARGVKGEGYIFDSLIWTKSIVEPVCTAIGTDPQRCWPQQFSCRQPQAKDGRTDCEGSPQFFHRAANRSRLVMA